jgi:pentatricopeptide repeat protein
MNHPSMTIGQQIILFVFLLVAERILWIDALVIPAAPSISSTTNLQFHDVCRARSHLMLVGAVREEIYLDLDSDSFDDNVDDDDDDGSIGQISLYDHMSHEKALAQRKKWIQQLHVLAKSSSTDPTAAAQAESIFDTMFQAYITSEDGSPFWPDTEVYNCLLETHAFSVDRKNYYGAKAAEMLLERMEDPENEMVARPDAQSYSHIMDAWAIRSEPEKARVTLERQIQRYQDMDEDELLRPTADAFNKLIKAFGIAGDVDGAEKIFRQMSAIGNDDNDDDADDDVDELSPRTFGIQADNKSWVQLMKAYLGNDQDEKVGKLFNEMIDAYRMGNKACKPQTESYNQLIRATHDPKTAEGLLFEMIGEKDEDVRPNSETFRQVLRSYSNQMRANNNNNNNKGTSRKRSTIPMTAVAAKIDLLVQIQEGLYESNDKSEDLRLDDRSCQLALGSIARSSDQKKAIIARRVFDKFRLHSPPSTTSYYYLLMACAYTKGKTEDKFEAFQIVRGALQELQSSPDLTIDSGCTGMCLKALSNLLPPGPKRDMVVETVFQNCCDAGLVNDFVVDQFGAAASSSLQLKMLGGFSEDEPSIPKKWKRNVSS